MKSLLVSATYFPPQVGGISRMMWEIAKALGPERVCCLTGVAGETAGGLEVYRTPHAFHGNAVRRAGSLTLALSKVLVRSRPRILQAATCYDGWLGLLLQRVLGMPFVVYAHGNEILEAAKDGWDKPRMALRGASRILACSRFTAGLVEEMGVSRDRIVRLAPGCDADRFHPQKIPKDSLPGIDLAGPVILTVGNLVERKGQDMVIRAVSLLREQIPGLQYILAGDGPYRPILEKLAAELGVRQQVVFAGRVADADLPRYYAASDVVVMASRQRLQASDVEGFGITFLEAAACGKPVIAGRSGGTSDAVVEGQTGLLIDPEAPAEIAGALARLLGDPAMALRMGEQARKRVLAEFTWQQVAERVADVLADVRDVRKEAAAE